MQFNPGYVPLVLTQSLSVARLVPVRLLVATAVMFVSGLAYDYVIETRPDSAPLVIFGNTLVVVLVQIFVTHTVVSGAGWMAGRPKRYPVMSMIGQGIILGLGIFAGLIALVLPGLFVASRWFIAAQILILEDVTAMAALRQSWDRTEEHWLAAFVVILVSAGGVAMSLAPLALNELWDASIGHVANIFFNGVLGATQVFTFVAATVLWRALSPDENRVSDIFD